ncbi:MAG: glycosyltransferase family 4 protein [Geodermatophilaceae bacterium]|nr:glycosyltransferase family 4 protein [Geodermatophilaceae bacterium]
MSGRVLVLGPLPPPVHGAAVVTQGMLEWLRECGASVRVVDSSADSHGIDSITSRRRAARYLLARLRSHLLCCLRLGSRPEVLYVGGAGGAGLLFQLLPVLVARVLRVPVVFHHHSSAYLSERSTPMAALCRLTTGNSTHIALSRQMAEQLLEKYAARGAGLRVVPLSNAIFVADAVPAPARQEAAPVRLGHVSNLSLDKGMQDIVDTAAALSAAGYPFELHVAGAARDESTQALVDALAVDPRVVVHGPLYGAALQQFYGGLDLLLFPSRYRHEAAPLVVLEAASQGVPTVAYPVGSLSEVVFATELLVDRGAFAAHVSDLVRRWEVVGAGLSAATVEGFRRSRASAAQHRESLWQRYLRRS